MARLEQEINDFKYKEYVTESLRLIPQRGYLTKSFKDVLGLKIDTRTGDEIAESVINGAGLTFEE